MALLALALLSLASQVITQRELSLEAGDSRLLNLAGRQRTLGQELCKAALLVQWSTDPLVRTKAVEELRRALSQLNPFHAALLTRDRSFGLTAENSAAIIALFAKFDHSQPFHEAGDLPRVFALHAPARVLF